MITTILMISLPLLLSKNYTIILTNSFLKKARSNFYLSKLQNHFTFLLPLYYPLSHLYTIGIIRNYDPIKQNYIFAPYHDPTFSLFVPQENVDISDVFLVPTHIPNSVADFLPKRINLLKLLLMTNLDLLTVHLYINFILSDT